MAIKKLNARDDKDFFYINNDNIDSHKIFISNEYEVGLIKKS